MNRQAGPGRTGRRRILTITVIVFLVALTLVIQHSRNPKAPYPASAVHAAVRLSVVPAGQLQQRLDALAGPGRLSAVLPQAGAQAIVGQLRFTTPHNAPKTGEYAVFVIDRHQDALVPGLWGVGPAGSTVTQGWNAHFDTIAASVPWLRALTPPKAANGITAGFLTALEFAPDTPAPVTFEAELSSDDVNPTSLGGALTVALVFLDTGGHVYWADNVTS